MICLYPDCGFTAPNDADHTLEQAKRTLITHINHEHADAHVLIACAHELKHIEDFTIRVNPQDGREPYDEPNRRSQCVRCGDFVVDAVLTDG
jgi:hypothetical protein